MSDYYDEEKQKDTLRLRERINLLPEFTETFFRGIAQTTSVKTRLGYAYDLRIFFNFLISSCRAVKGKKIHQLEVSDLASVKAEDIEKFLDYLTYYENEDDVLVKNDEKGKARKLAAVRAIFKYFYKKEKLEANPAALVDVPKIHQKAIVRLEVDEAARFLDEIENGDNLTAHQRAYYKKCRLRDLAIVTLLLGTGMRVSECVGINVGSLDFEQNGVLVTRKGGNQAVLYFGDEVREALLEYLDERAKKQEPMLDRDDPLFLSSHGGRITVRSVQNLVKKYAALVTGMKNISPHKLRSTYGTTLYRETGDIYLVADVLGHKDVNTTRKHYAEMEENRRKSAAKFVKLRGG